MCSRNLRPVRNCTYERAGYARVFTLPKLAMFVLRVKLTLTSKSVVATPMESVI